MNRKGRPARRRRRTAEAIVAGASELFEERGFALACFQAAYERWVRDPGQDLPALVDESFAALAGLAG